MSTISPFHVAVAEPEAGTPFETNRLDNLETMRRMENVYRAAGVEVMQ